MVADRKNRYLQCYGKLIDFFYKTIYISQHLYFKTCQYQRNIIQINKIYNCPVNKGNSNYDGKKYLRLIVETLF